MPKREIPTHGFAGHGITVHAAPAMRHPPLQGFPMLELRPTCENCNKALPPASLDACICSFECTYCRDCVEQVLAGVCPNCGGGFVPRPIRPARDWKNGNYLGRHPATTKVTHKPVDVAAHAALVARMAGTAPADR
jgi:uncharacterized protein